VTCWIKGREGKTEKGGRGGGKSFKEVRNLEGDSWVLGYGGDIAGFEGRGRMAFRAAKRYATFGFWGGK